MPVQTSVADVMPRGFPGTKRSDTRYMTCISTESTAEIPFGLGVVGDSASGQLANRQAAKLPTSATDMFLGVGLRNHHSDTALGATVSGPKPGRDFEVAYDGEVLVKVESAVVKDGRAFMRFADGAGGTQKGVFRANADTNTAVELKGCYFMESGAAGSLVWMRVDAAATRATR